MFVSCVHSPLPSQVTWMLHLELMLFLLTRYRRFLYLCLFSAFLDPFCNLYFFLYEPVCHILILMLEPAIPIFFLWILTFFLGRNISKERNLWVKMNLSPRIAIVSELLDPAHASIYRIQRPYKLRTWSFLLFLHNPTQRVPHKRLIHSVCASTR
jgi:hypothetical protein